MKVTSLPGKTSSLRSGIEFQGEAGNIFLHDFRDKDDSIQKQPGHEAGCRVGGRDLFPMLPAEKLASLPCRDISASEPCFQAPGLM